MASATIEEILTIQLTLTKKEALVLKGLVQNPICTTPEEELASDREWRESIWNALPSFEQLF